jgi:ABC-type lipoprotein release transport system permease subunit
MKLPKDFGSQGFDKMLDQAKDAMARAQELEGKRPTEPVKPEEKGVPSATRPLAPPLYLLRNAGKTAPLAAVITLAVLLVAGIVAMMDSIPFSIKVIYSYTQTALGISPRWDPNQTPKLREIIEKECPVPVERLVTCRAASGQVKSIVGKWPFVVLGLEQNDMRYYLQRLKATDIQGRLPEAGKAEALVSEPVARNRGLKLGSDLLSPVDSDNYSPFHVKVVGIANTDKWIMVTNIEYLRAYQFPAINFLLVFAPTPEQQQELDLWAEQRFKGLRAQIFAYHILEQDTNDMFRILYKILDVVIGTLVLVITIMMGMLMNIYQSQRLVEFGLLQALGYTKRQLLRRVTMESLLVIIGGWILGMIVAYGLLNVVKATLMDPSAFSLNTLDPVAFAYTIPIPIAIFCAAVFTVWLRFRSFDPVGVVERRLV